MDRRDREFLKCDVMVVGGGAAGVAAAVTAARRGLRVVMAERYGFAGGGAVAGLSGTICGLYLATERTGHAPEQVVFGFADEFRRRLQQRGGLGPALTYGKTATHVHDPLAWKETADTLLEEAGVLTIYHATATGVLTDGEALEGVTLWTKQGVVEVRSKIVIDASGDADIVAMAGLPTHTGDHGRVQNPTMIFRLLGVDVDRFRTTYGEDTIMPPEVAARIEAARARGADLPRSKIWMFPTTRPGELLCNCTRIVGDDGRELNALFWRDFSEAEINGRKQARAYADFFRGELEGCEEAFINETAVQVGIRQTRQVTGVELLANDDVLAARKHADGIARSPWPIELHSGEKPKVHWILDDYYEVPFGCFVPRGGERLLTAGRCLSAEHEAVASARVTAQCFSYGHAVGWAAWLAVQERIPVRQIGGADVRQLLNRDGAALDG